jgi:hypothetical protein
MVDYKKITILCLILFFNCSYADDSTRLDSAPIQIYQNKDYYFDFKFGPSQFNGLIGLEVRRSHYAIGLSFPTTLSFKYYVDPSEDTVYYGFFSGHYINSSYDKVKDGIYYDELEYSHSGIGTGYRWQWDSGWSLDTSITIGARQETYRNRFLTRHSDFQFYGFGIVGGYSF